MTIAEFLLTRIAETESVIANWPDEVPHGKAPGGVWVDVLGRPITSPKATGLAECGAKRRIVERHRWAADHPDWSGDMELDWDGAWATLCDLAAIYADHPDYDEAWRP